MTKIAIWQIFKLPLSRCKKNYDTNKYFKQNNNCDIAVRSLKNRKSTYYF